MSEHNSLFRRRPPLDHEADPNYVNDCGQSILAGVAFNAHEAIMRALLAICADLRLRTLAAIESAHVFGCKYILAVLGAKEGNMRDDAQPT